MSNIAKTPTLADLARLGEQIELDRSASMQELRQRDHAIGLRCDASDDTGRLLFWLQSMSDRPGPPGEARMEWLSEASAAMLMRLLAFVLGFSGMTGFLLAGDNGLTNFFVFLLLFVLIQIVLWVISAVVMTMSLRGDVPVVFPLNPARFVVERSIPDMRYLRESRSVIRILLLRYGQEMGAIFTLGAVAAFLTVVGLKHIIFFWESHYITSEGLERFTAILSLPWASWLPDATLTEQVIRESWDSAAVDNLAQDKIKSMRDWWWPFLIMAMLCYAVIPRIILWILSRVFYVKLMRRSFVQYPGSEGILLRMKSPLVSTQAQEPEESGYAGRAGISLDERLLLLTWAGAFETDGPNQFEEIRMVPPGNVLAAGLGTLASDELCIERINEYRPARLLVAVKAWEPPMGELQDFLDRLEQVTRCTLYLVPLPGRVVTDLHLQEWRDFSRELRFDAVDTQPLSQL